MSSEMTTPLAPAEPDESTVSRAELHIEREKIQIERERLALERERMAAERERWKSDAEWKARAEGRGVAFSTLVFVGMICVLAGVIAGFFTNRPRAARMSTARIEALSSKASTNVTDKAGNSILLRPLDAGSGSKAYLLILE